MRFGRGITESRALLNSISALTKQFSSGEKQISFKSMLNMCKPISFV